MQLIEPDSQCLGLLGLLWGNLERNFKDRFCWGKDLKKKLPGSGLVGKNRRDYGIEGKFRSGWREVRTLLGNLGFFNSINDFC